MKGLDPNVRPRLWIRRLAIATVVAGASISALEISRCKCFPLWQTQVSATKHTSLSTLSPQPYQGEQELLKYAFTEPVIEGDLLYEPITSLEGIREANERIFMLRESFEAAYSTLTITNATQLQLNRDRTPVVKISFTYQEYNYDAYAYGKLPPQCNRLSRASLIIPGSGENQSKQIFSHDQENYHFGIQTALDTRGGDVFIFIKPNEDILAWHNGQGHKLNGDFIWNWHLNREGSYSVSYLIQSLAIARWMKQCYSNFALVGLSQGGAATLLNALQSDPTIAVVASGHSLINKQAEWSSHNQLIGVPGYSDLFEMTILKEKLAASPTQWLFSWGLNEVGTYRIEAEKRLTSQAIEALPNVQTVIFEGGHRFPVDTIKVFFEETF